MKLIQRAGTPLILFLMVLLAGCVNRSRRPVSDQGTWLDASADLSRGDRIKLATQARNGDAEAAFRLHDYHSIAHYNEIKAMQWLGLSARLGFVPAQYYYGFRLSKSKSAADNREAVRWFKVAAEAGDPTAQRALGEALQSGRGTAVDLRQARKWYEKAAKAGDSTAAEKLMQFLSMGDGGPPDRVMAYAWADLIYSRHKGTMFGNSVFLKRENLRESLSEEELKHAERESVALQESVPTDHK
jgi:TPR repeat protein